MNNCAGAGVLITFSDISSLFYFFIMQARPYQASIAH